MPQNITDSNAFTTPIVAPADGDAGLASSVLTGFQGLANRTYYLQQLLSGVSFNGSINMTGSIGVTATTGAAVSGTATSGKGIQGTAGNSGVGVYGANTGNGYAVEAITVGSGVGIWLDTSGGTANGLVFNTNSTGVPIQMATQGAVPSGFSPVGSLYMATGGVLKVCTVAGTGGAATWVSVGSQT